MKAFPKVSMLIAALCTFGTAIAQEYPARPIRIIVPFPAGGGTDISARVVGQKITEALGQQIIVDNRAGASGNIAMEIAARAEPDGYTLILSTVGPAAMNAATFASLPFDPRNDFAPVVLVSSTVFAVGCRAHGEPRKSLLQEASQSTSGFVAGTTEKRLKSRSADQSSRT